MAVGSSSWDNLLCGVSLWAFVVKIGNMKYRVPVFILSGILFGALSLHGISLEGVEIQVGGSWYGNAEENQDTPSPLTLSGGISLPLRLSSILFFYPEVLVSSGNFRFNQSSRRVVPASIETYNRTSVLQLLINPAVVIGKSVNRKHFIGGSISPSAIIRIPLEAFDRGDEYMQTLKDHFYDPWNILHLSAGIVYRWEISNSIGVGTSLIGHYPMKHLWDLEELPFWNHLTILASFRLSFLF